MKTFKLTDDQVLAVAKVMPDEISRLELTALVAFLAEEVYGFSNEDIETMGQHLVDIVANRRERANAN